MQGSFPRAPADPDEEAHVSGWHWLLVCWLAPGVCTLVVLLLGALKSGVEDVRQARQAATTSATPLTARRPRAETRAA